ncbi:hypothetical protein BDK51DRAFT_29095 [Blyttiomyces helicus]|uniref:Enkurin domain-containing protein n=1 Tax=Blyttiomyces helicus TaxID=388810 RepID=A0A4P9WQN5_9FUNG|nr:hypothetical protein BDK51DRAFT_29095 [Blyttiomyces helicus]|eukprot:RKO94493.1 hypothetical protein BDK51DRAFT_29095 [Blyttiomyces helicus]
MPRQRDAPTRRRAEAAQYRARSLRFWVKLRQSVLASPSLTSAVPNWRRQAQDSARLSNINLRSSCLSSAMSDAPIVTVNGVPVQQIRAPVDPNDESVCAHLPRLVQDRSMQPKAVKEIEGKPKGTPAMSKRPAQIAAGSKPRSRVIAPAAAEPATPPPIVCHGVIGNSGESHRLLPETERLDILAGLQINWEKLMGEYRKMPVTDDSPSKIKKKAIVEARLQKLEGDIRKFSSRNIIVEG